MAAASPGAPRRARRGAAAAVALLGALGGGLAGCGSEAPTGAVAGSGASSTLVPPTCTKPADLGNAVAALDYELREFSVRGPQTGPVGPVAVLATNVGTVPHQLLVVRAGGLGELPRRPDGSLDEAALDPGQVVAKLGPVDPGRTCGAVPNLAAGQYVLVCNLVARSEEGDDVSHLASGMVLDLQITA